MPSRPAICSKKTFSDWVDAARSHARAQHRRMIPVVESNLEASNRTICDRRERLGLHEAAMSHVIAGGVQMTMTSMRSSSTAIRLCSDVSAARRRSWSMAMPLVTISTSRGPGANLAEAESCECAG